MKTKKYCIGLLLPMLIFSSCLEEKLYNSYKVDSFFTDVVKLDQAVLGCYTPLNRNETYGQNMFVAFDGDSDLQFVDGPGVGTGNSARDMGHYYISTDEIWILNAWKLFYEGIKNTNIVLANADKVFCNGEDDELEKQRLIAEAKFLRAIYYFDLVRFWGDVPLLTEPIEYNSNVYIQRTPRNQVYDQIVKDLTEAINVLPWHDEVGQYVGRAHKGAAMGYLVRVNMYRAGYSLYEDGTMKRPDNYMDYYKEAEKWSKELINSKKHELNPDYAKIFKNHCELKLEPKESIFEAELLYDAGGGIKGGAHGVYNAPKTVKGVYQKTTARISTHMMFYKMFDENDKRRDISVANYSLDENGQHVRLKESASQNYKIGKWSREYQTDAQFESESQTSLNFVLLRYADVLLMRSEALNEINNGPTDEAVELINQVRRRGFGKSILTKVTETDEDGYVDKKLSDFTGHDDFLKFIQDERARELAFECVIRKTDLVRWNILGKTLRETSDYIEKHKSGDEVYYEGNFIFSAANCFIDNQHELYPIPSRERRENPYLTQNPGYTK